MYENEKQLEKAVIESMPLDIKGKTVDYVDNQLKIGRHYIDILGQDEDETFYIIEIKKGIVDGNALSQILDYKSRLKKFFELYNIDNDIKMVLIGEKLDSKMELAISEVNDLYFYKYVPTVFLQEESWALTDGFKGETLELFHTLFDISYLNKKEDDVDGKETNGK